MNFMLIFLKSASACCTTFAFAPVLYRCCIPWLQEYPPLDLMGNGPGGGPRTLAYCCENFLGFCSHPGSFLFNLSLKVAKDFS